MGDNENIGNTAQINKFNGKNYQQWKFQIKCALRAKGVYDIVVGTEKKPQETETNAKEVKSWSKNDAMAMCILTSAMDLNQISLVENCNSSKEILDKLNSIYEQRTETNKMIVHERFYQYKMELTDSVAQHISKTESLARQIKESGDTISNTAVITKILSTLPAKYMPFRQAWLSMEEGKQTLENLTARLLDEEANLNSNTENENAFIASGSKGPYTGNQKSSKSKFKCYNCNKKGHFAKDCRAPKKQSTNKGNKNNGKYSKATNDNDQGGAFNTEVNSELEVLIGNLETTWLMDSGASRHMSPNRNFFASLHETNDLAVHLGNNEQLAVKGIGTIHIEKWVDGKWCNGILEEVWYVPGLRRNLFSEGAVTKKGFTIVKGNTKAEIFEDDKLVGSATRDKNNLYKMLIRAKAVTHEANTVTSGTLKEWHERLGHINTRSLKQLFSKELVGRVELTDCEEFFCESCVYAKQHKLKFPPIERHVTKPGELVYSDVCGPMSVDSIGGSRYFVLFKDDSTSYCEVMFIKHKSDVYERFRDFIKKCSNKFGHEIKRVRVDNGTEFINHKMKELLSVNGIVLETTGIYTPEQNGRCERENRTIVESARAMLYTKDIPLELWAEAVNTAVYLLNRTPNSHTKDSTPYEKWTGKKPSLDHVKVFGSDAYLHVPDSLRKKLSKKGEKHVFVGYEGNSTNYRLYNTETGKIKVSRHVVFNENSSVTLPRQNTVLVNIKNNQQDVNENDVAENKFPVENEPTPDVEEPETSKTFSQRDLQQREKVEETERSKTYHLRQRQNLRLPEYLNSYEVENELNLTEFNIPLTYEEAMKSPERDNWKIAINEELESLEVNKTWELTTLPPGKKPVGSKWVFKIKSSPNKSNIRFKARLCAKGFSQVEGIDYNETFAPTTRYDTIRMLLSLAVQRKLHILQFDVKTAFLYGEIAEDIYMNPPPGVNIGPEIVCKLRKSLYGLKQAPRCWNSKFNEFLNSIGLKQCQADKCVYQGKFDDELVILVLYVDDGLVLAKDRTVLEKILKQLECSFKICISEPDYFVGLEIKSDKDSESISISVSAFIERVLNRFNLTEANGHKIPADPNTCLTNREVEPMDEIVPYREMVGSLIFAATAARPDIAYITNILSRNFNCYGKIHWNAAKRVLKYLKTTKDYGIKYTAADNPQNNLVITGYSDADFAGDLEGRRSTTGYVFKANDNVITWRTQRQQCVTCSTTEAEYIAASEACKEAIWLKQFFSELGESVSPIKLYVDNQSALKLIKNPVFHHRTKHIDVRYHFVRERYNNGDIDIEFIPSKMQIADVFTKALPFNLFDKFRNLMNMSYIENL